MGKKYQQQTGESLPDFRKRCRDAEALLKPPVKPKRVRRLNKVSEQRVVPDPDGRDFDNLGESPDF